MEQALTPLPTRPVKSFPDAPAPTREVALVRRSKNNIQFTRRQIQFINYYLAGNTAAKSALLAGYSEKTALIASSLILRNPKIAAEIRNRSKAKFDALEANADRVLEETANMAFSNILDFVEIEKDGSFKLDLSKVDRAQGAAIQELCYDVMGRPRIRLYDKKASLDFYAKLKKIGNFAENNSGDGSPVTVASLDAIVQQTVNNITINQYGKSNSTDSNVIDAEVVSP